MVTRNCHGSKLHFCIKHVSRKSPSPDSPPLSPLRAAEHRELVIDMPRCRTRMIARASIIVLEPDIVAKVDNFPGATPVVAGYAFLN